MNASLVAFNKLYQGGIPPTGRTLQRQKFDLLVLCAEEFQPEEREFPGVRVVHAPFEDHDILPAELALALEASREVSKALLQGQKVLVTCRMGLNRSGLVTGLALVRLGVSPSRAAALIRAARGPWALSNGSFEKSLLSARQK